MTDNPSFIEEAPLSPPAQQSTSATPFVEETTNGVQPSRGGETPIGPTSRPSSSWSDIGKGVLRGAAEATGFMPVDIEGVLQRYPYTPSEKIAEKAGIGATFGAPFGPVGAASGAVGGGTEEAVNQSFPGHEGLAMGAGLIAGMGSAPIIANLAEFGAKSLRSVPEQFGLFSSPVNSLYGDVGKSTVGGMLSGEGSTRIAGANDGWTSLMQVQNALREGLGGSAQIRQTEQRIFNAVEQRASGIADGLGPNLTHQELGQFIQHNAGLRVDQIKGEIDGLYTALDSLVPRTTNINPANFTNMLHSIEGKYTGAPELGKVFQQSGIQKMLDAVNSDLWHSPTGTIPYDVVKNMRTDIGEMIGKGALNPEVNVKELRAIYASLTSDMEAAYTSPGALRAFRTVNAVAERGFDTIEQTLQPLVKAGLNPETITTRLLAQANKGSSRIDDIVSQLNNVDPDSRNVVMGYVLRGMGETPQKNFNPATFYANWQKLSPEAKDLFPRSQQEGIDRLAQLSGLVADSFDAANRSHTAGNLDILQRIGQGVRYLTQAATSMVGAAGAGVAGQEPLVGAAVGGSLGGFLATTLGESTVNNMLAKLWTNRAFNTWIATEAPNLNPGKLATSMASLAAQEPQIADGLNYLSAFIGGSAPSSQSPSSPSLRPGEKGRGFALGGLTSTPSTIPKTGHPNKFKGKQLQGYAEGGMTSDIASRMIQNESRGQNVKNPLSSASGPGQFLDSTWTNMMAKYHPEISNPLSVKGNDKLNTEMTMRYGEENSKYLSSHGITPTGGTLYLAHFLGPAGALKVLSSDPSTPVSSLFSSKVTSANPFMKGMTGGQLVSLIDKKMGGKGETLMASHSGNSSAPSEEGSSIVDDFMSHAQEEEPQEAEANDEPSSILKDAIMQAPWIEPETKIASKAILEA